MTLVLSPQFVTQPADDTLDLTGEDDGEAAANRLDGRAPDHHPQFPELQVGQLGRALGARQSVRPAP